MAPCNRPKTPVCSRFSTTSATAVLRTSMYPRGPPKAPTICVACIQMMPSWPPTLTAMIWQATRRPSRAVWLTRLQRVPRRLMRAPQMKRLKTPQMEVWREVLDLHAFFWARGLTVMPRMDTCVAVAESISMREQRRASGPSKGGCVA